MPKWRRAAKVVSSQILPVKLRGKQVLYIIPGFGGGYKINPNRALWAVRNPNVFYFFKLYRGNCSFYAGIASKTHETPWKALPSLL